MQRELLPSESKTPTSVTPLTEHDGIGIGEAKVAAHFGDLPKAWGLFSWKTDCLHARQESVQGPFFSCVDSAHRQRFHFEVGFRLADSCSQHSRTDDCSKVTDTLGEIYVLPGELMRFFLFGYPPVSQANISTPLKPGNFDQECAHRQASSTVLPRGSFRDRDRRT